MKKYLAVMMALAMTAGMGMAAMAAETEAEADDPKGEGVMTYEEFMNAEVDDEVVVEAYVQAKQAWYEGNESRGTDTATVYAQDHDGGYFFYDMECSAEDYEKLVPGEDGEYIAEPVDVTELLGDEEAIAAYQNQKVAFKGLTVEAADDSGAAFLYNWDGSGTDGNDLYFNVSLDGNTYSFTVESYLCDNTTDVYKAVKELKVGDVVDLEGFLYWYEGINPHITAVSVQ